MIKYKYFDIILALSAVTLVVSNISATKLIDFGSIGSLKLIFDGGAVMFPIAYIIGDVLTEVYGYNYARRAIWVGFALMIISSLVFTIVRVLPADASYQDQQAFEAIFGYVPRIVVASLVAYLCGEFLNAFVLAKMKVQMKGQKMWARLIGSTVVGEFADTTIFCLVAFAGTISWSDMASYIFLGWAFKTCVEAVMLPVTYRVIAFLKQAERADFYDKKTDFNPFALDTK